MLTLENDTGRNGLLISNCARHEFISVFFRYYLICEPFCLQFQGAQASDKVSWSLDNAAPPDDVAKFDAEEECGIRVDA